MKRTLTHGACLVAIAAVAACADTLSSGLTRTSAVPLQFTLPNAAALSAPRIDMRVSSRPVSRPHDLGGNATTSSLTAVGSTATTAGLSEPVTIRGPETKAYFYPYNGGYVAIAEGYMTYFGNRAQHTTSATVATPSGSLLNATEITADSHLLPLWRGFQSFARIPIVGNCGFSVMGSTAHKAWYQSPFPGTDVSSEFATAHEHSSSALQTLAPCPPQIKTTTGTGGEGDSRLTDTSWTICYWLVWYDGTGAEISRELLYCRPL